MWILFSLYFTGLLCKSCFYFQEKKDQNKIQIGPCQESNLGYSIFAMGTYWKTEAGWYDKSYVSLLLKRSFRMSWKEWISTKPMTASFCGLYLALFPVTSTLLTISPMLQSAKHFWTRRQKKKYKPSFFYFPVSVPGLLLAETQWIIPPSTFCCCCVFVFLICWQYYRCVSFSPFYKANIICLLKCPPYNRFKDHSNSMSHYDLQHFFP